MRGPAAAPWWLLIAALGLPALALPLVDLGANPAPASPWVQALTLHPDQGLHQPPWVWWTTAWLHGSAAHLWRNLGALLLIGALGHAWGAGARQALWLALAWPLTQLGMLAQSDLHTYVGLSGVLHAAFSLLVAQALCQPPPVAPRWLSGLALLGLLTKLLLENPWQMSLVPDTASAINVAPWVHFCGAIVGFSLGCLPRRIRIGFTRDTTA
jgi:membrane associated rhomboid family serine protease